MNILSCLFCHQFIMEGSSCKVYSESNQKWFDGEIVKILNDKHVRVHYGDDMEKDLHIDDKYLKISPNTSPIQQKGRTIYVKCFSIPIIFENLN